MGHIHQLLIYVSLFY